MAALATFFHLGTASVHLRSRCQGLGRWPNRQRCLRAEGTVRFENWNFRNDRMCQAGGGRRLFWAFSRWYCWQLLLGQVTFVFRGRCFENICRLCCLGWMLPWVFSGYISCKCAVSGMLQCQPRQNQQTAGIMAFDVLLWYKEKLAWNTANISARKGHALVEVMQWLAQARCASQLPCQKARPCPCRCQSHPSHLNLQLDQTIGFQLGIHTPLNPN